MYQYGLGAKWCNDSSFSKWCTVYLLQDYFYDIIVGLRFFFLGNPPPLHDMDMSSVFT